MSKEYERFCIIFTKRTDLIALSNLKEWDCKISLKEETRFSTKCIYELSVREQKILKKHVKNIIKKEYTIFFTSLAEHSILFTVKSNESLRLCMNYRKLNAITIKNRYSLSLIRELRIKLIKVKYFIKLNLKKEFNLIRIKKKEKWKTIFLTRQEQFEYRIMSFELTNASTIFWKVMNKILEKFIDDFTMIYI